MNNLSVIECNLLECDKINGFIHQANCFHTMGSGIARQIKLKYPELYEADCNTFPKGSRDKLGNFSWAKLSNGKVGYNLYSQYNYGNDGKRYTSYDAMDEGLRRICKHICENYVSVIIGLPYNMGCGYGGGNWNIVSNIIHEAFTGNGIEYLICKYEP